jgi:hypothetical protein
MTMKKVNKNAKSLQEWRQLYKVDYPNSTEVEEITFAANKAKQGLLNEPPALVEYIMFNY